MFSSLKLNSLKCQSNGSESDGKKDGKPETDDGDDVSDHMYEKLPSLDSRSCKCHSDHLKKGPKPTKNSFGKRISKWKMECPGITNLRNNRSFDDNDEDDDVCSNHQNHQDAKNNHQEGRLRGIPSLEHYQKLGPVRTKVMTVNLEREDGNLGITLRGGFHQNSDLSRPVVITYVKPDGPAARLGTIKPGDRLLAVDGVSLQGSTLTDAQKLLKQPSATTLLTIEYSVSVLDSVEHANGPLLVEIEKSSNQQLGLTLFQNDDGCIVVERVKPGSLADRCGALHVGDEILAVNATRISGTSTSLEDVMKVLECEYPIVRLEILPSYASSCFSRCGTWKTRADTLGSTSSGMSTIKGTLHRKNRDIKKSKPENGIDYKCASINSHGMYGAEIALTHSETLHTILTKENGTFGLQFIDAPDGSILINSVTPDGPAERSQCLHPGDRLLSINHTSVGLNNLKAKDINDLLDVKSDENGSCCNLNIHTEFDVLDTVVPSSGIFMAKLVKRGSAGLGITMTASKSYGFIVSEMKKGSIAHRSGSLKPGDRLLAINNIPLEHCSVEYAAHIFYQSANIVTLKVQREENSDFRNSSRKITYTVDLQRYGGPLGITIAGSEEPSHPITISGLTAGGLAEQTGVIHVGDEILAINNHSLQGEPLSKAHILLQNSSDLVTLKLSRPLMPICRLPNNTSPILPSSIDSAVESWDSSHLDLTSSPDQQKPPRDPHDDDKLSSNVCQQWQPHSSNNGQGFSESTTEPVKSESAAVESIGATNSDLAILDEITSENLKLKHELDLLSIKLDEQRKSKLASASCDMDQPASSGNGQVSPKFSDKHDSVLNVDSSGEVITARLKNADFGDEENVYGKGTLTDNVGNDTERECRGRDSMMTTDFEKFEMAYLPETRNWCANQYLGCENSQEFIRSEFQSSQLYEVTLYKDPVYEDFGFSVSDGLYERGVFINRIRKGGPADLSNVLKPYDRILQVNKTFTQDFDCCLTVPLIASAGDSLILLVARNPTTASSSLPEHEGFEYDRYQLNEMAMTGDQLDACNHEDLRRILV